MNWKNKRIDAINRQIERKGKYGNRPAIVENYIDEQNKRKLLKELKNSKLITEHTRVIFILALS